MGAVMTWTRYADQAPTHHQVVIVQLHGETHPDGTTVESEPVRYYQPATTAAGATLGPRWASWDDRANKNIWERIHPDDHWAPAKGEK